MLNFIDFQIFLFIYFLVVNFFAIHAGRFRVAVALFCIHCVAIWKYIHVLNLLDVSPPAPSSWKTYEIGLHTLNFRLIFCLFFFFSFFLILCSSLLCSSLLIASGNATPSHIPKTASRFSTLTNGCNLQVVL